MSNTLTRSELGAALGLSVETLNRYRKRGMPVIRVGRHVRYDRDACVSWIMSNVATVGHVMRASLDAAK